MTQCVCGKLLIPSAVQINGFIQHWCTRCKHYRYISCSISASTLPYPSTSTQNPFPNSKKNSLPNPASIKKNIHAKVNDIKDEIQKMLEKDNIENIETKKNIHTKVTDIKDEIQKILEKDYRETMEIKIKKKKIEIEEEEEMDHYSTVIKLKITRKAEINNNTIIKLKPKKP